VPRGLDGDRLCVGDRVQGGGDVQHHGGVNGCSGEGLHSVLHSRDGLTEDDEGDFQSVCIRRSLY
jgi:hypothetical protein